MEIKSPYTEVLNTFKKNQIIKKFPELQNASCDSYISIYKYISHKPECFYNHKVFSLFFDWLNLIEKTESEKVKNYFFTEANKISNAIRFLNQINELKIHDEVISGENNYNLLENIDRYIHPNYLRLVESVFAHLIHPIAHFSRLHRNAKVDDLDVFNSVKEIHNQHANMMDIILPYKHIIRNGIAHDGISYLNNEIEYSDKKGNSERFCCEDIINIFDDMLDICNGMMLALKIFFVLNHTRGYVYPLTFAIEELIEQTENKWVQVNNCIPMMIRSNISQLVIYSTVKTTDFHKVRFFMFIIATLVESLLPEYNKYFISFTSKCALPGWFAFEGEKLAFARLSSCNEYSVYKDVVDERNIFFASKYKFPKFIYKIDSLNEAFFIHKKLIAEELDKIFKKYRIHVYNSENHLNKFSLVINADCVIKFAIETNILDFVKENYKKIINNAANQIKKKIKVFSVNRVLPIGFVRLSVFEESKRKRSFRRYGLGENLVCVIKLNKLPGIRCPDILNSVTEQHGVYRIEWNKKWLEKNLLCEIISENEVK